MASKVIKKRKEENANRLAAECAKCGFKIKNLPEKLFENAEYFVPMADSPHPDKVVYSVFSMKGLRADEIAEIIHINRPFVPLSDLFSDKYGELAREWGARCSRQSYDLGFFKISKEEAGKIQVGMLDDERELTRTFFGKILGAHRQFGTHFGDEFLNSSKACGCAGCREHAQKWFLALADRKRAEYELQKAQNARKGEEFLNCYDDEWNQFLGDRFGYVELAEAVNAKLARVHSGSASVEGFLERMVVYSTEEHLIMFQRGAGHFVRNILDPFNDGTREYLRGLLGIEDRPERASPEEKKVLATRFADAAVHFSRLEFVPLNNRIEELLQAGELLAFTRDFARATILYDRAHECIVAIPEYARDPYALCELIHEWKSRFNLHLVRNELRTAKEYAEKIKAVRCPGAARDADDGLPPDAGWELDKRKRDAVDAMMFSANALAEKSYAGVPLDDEKRARLILNLWLHC